MGYFGTAINDSATLVDVANADMAGVGGLALKFDASSGKFVLPSAGEPVIGIALIDTPASVLANDDVAVQIKDIALWKTGAAVAKGAELASNSAGKAIAATAGTFIVAIALKAASGADVIIPVQIVKAGYKNGLTLAALADVALGTTANGDALIYNSSTSKWVNHALNLDDLADVDLTTPPTNGQALKYVSANSVFKAVT